MTKRLLLNTVASLLIGLSINTQAAEDFKPSSSVVTLMPIVMDNLDILNLRLEQINDVRAIARKNFSVVEFINAEYHNLKTELKEVLLDANNLNTQRATQIVAELAELDKKRMTLTLECAFGLKKALGEDKFQEIVSTLEFQSH